MRLITRHVYRAIPDLDGFSDETCRRIVAQVYRLKWIQISIAMIVAFVCAVPVAVIVALVFAMLFGSVSGSWRSELSFYLGGLLTIATIIGLPSFAAFQVRNYMLLLGCGWLVARKDRCAACAYPLTGLRTAPDQTVRCPECGTDSKPDSAVNEIAAAAATSTTPPPSSSPHH